MRKLLGGALALCICFSGSVLASDEPVSLESFKDKLSYGIGLDIGTNLSVINEEIDLDKLVIGLTDAFGKKPSRLTPEQLSEVQQKFAQKIQEKQRKQLEEIMTKNAAAAKAYLEENKKKEGVKVTESGLQYEVLKEGTGKTPVATDMVKVDYVGTLIDGTEFDSSIKRGQPVVFSVGKVIPGWTEALQLMKVGAKYRLVIPPELAYGETGASPVIEPNSLLIFEVDLLGIEEEEKPAE